MPALPAQVRLFLAREIVADAGNAALRAIRARVVVFKATYKRLREGQRYFRLRASTGVYSPVWARALYSAIVCIHTIESNYYVRLYYNII